MRHIQQFTYMPLFEPWECDTVRIQCDTVLTLEKAGVLSEKKSWKDRLTRNVNSAWLYESPGTRWIYEHIKKNVQDMNSQFLNFEIQGMETLQYLEYGPLQFYRKHVDNGHDDVANRKLTAIIQLSHPSEYIGGGTRIDSHTNINGRQVNYAPKNKGCMTLFPSHLPHVAEPVLWGTRRVLVAWFRGRKPLS
jgi:predicted 2-oxoglutarate/Fe(II)-dependent dioxygenase YbiX